jgi:hypothetical protein
MTTFLSRSIKKWASPLKNSVRRLVDLSQHGKVLGGDQMSPSALETFRTWHECVNYSTTGNTDSDEGRRLISKLTAQVDNNCTFYPPTYFSHWEGRDEFVLLIVAVSEVFGKSFTYGRQWISPDGSDWALEFSAEIESSKKVVHGIDLVKLGSDGKIIDFRVLARPPNAVQELKAAMMKKVPMRLAALKARRAMSSVFGKNAD